MHQLRSDRTINTTAHGPNYSTLWTTDVPNARNLLSNEFFLEIKYDVVVIREEKDSSEQDEAP